MVTKKWGENKIILAVYIDYTPGGYYWTHIYKVQFRHNRLNYKKKRAGHIRKSNRAEIKGANESHKNNKVVTTWRLREVVEQTIVNENNNQVNLIPNTEYT